MRRFAHVKLGDDIVPDGTTILRFRHLLETHRLTEAIFAAVKELLIAKRLLLQSGTIVDAIIAAPSSTKNAARRARAAQSVAGPVGRLRGGTRSPRPGPEPPVEPGAPHRLCRG
jgi:IS5 family transposase